MSVISSATVDGVKAAIQSFLGAYAANNQNDLAQWTSEQLTFGHASGRAENQQQFILSRSKKPVYAEIVPSEQRVSLAGNVAVVHQAITRKRQDGRTRMDKEMVVWIFKDGRWKLISRQGVKYTGNAFG